MDEETLAEISQKIVSEFSKKVLKICAAESCTGGLVASSIVSVQNASSVFAGSAVCYCDSAKRDILGVEESLLEKYFAESSECAAEMAKGAARVFKADIAVSTTGFLDGNTGNKPKTLSGVVFVACFSNAQSSEPKTDVCQIQLDVSKSRNENRSLVAQTALNMILSLL